MRRTLIGTLVGLAVAGAGFAGANMASGSSTSTPAAPSRLDDGKNLVGQAGITEQQAIDAALGATSGGLNEIDLEHYRGTLVYNVDVGGSDVKVDASNGEVLATPADD